MGFPSNRAVKTTARAALKGNWVYASCAAMIPLVTILFFGILASVLASVSNSFWAKAAEFVIHACAFLFAVFPLLLGTVRFFKDFTKNDRRAQFEEIFFYFSSYKIYKRALAMSFTVFFRLFIVGGGLLLPAILTDFIAHGKLSEILNTPMPLWFENLWIISLFFRGIAAAFLIIIIFKYYQLPYIFVLNDEISPLEAIHLSACVSRVSSAAFLSLFISFFAYFILSALILPLVFTLPYMFTAYAVHCNFAVFHYNRRVCASSEKQGTDMDFEI